MSSIVMEFRLLQSSVLMKRRKKICDDIFILMFFVFYVSLCLKWQLF